jgi:hypothetical protein
MLIDRQDFITFAEEGYRYSLKMIDDDGYLKAESHRGARSAIYHAFAAQPLALYRIFRRLKGFKPVDDEWRLDALLKLVRGAKTDPSLFEGVAGVTQLHLGQQYWLDFVDSVEHGASGPVKGKDRRLGGSLEMLRKAVQQAMQRSGQK